MRVFITGATGFVGRAVVLRLLGEGHAVCAWVRDQERARAMLGAEVTLAPAEQGLAGLVTAVETADAVINLAGEPIAAGRLTRARRERIVRSRLELTRQLVDAMTRCQSRPAALISASAVGFYGDRGDDTLDESSGAGAGFLSELCVRWEQAAERAEALGVRVVRLRIGVVLGLGGGFLDRVLPLARSGLAARLGTGRQFVPWIHLDDLVRVITAALTTSSYRGAIDAVTAPARMDDLMRVTARAVGSRPGFAVPRALLRLGLGDAADVLLFSQNTRGGRLAGLGFKPDHATLDGAVGDLVDRLAEVAIAPLGAGGPAPSVAGGYLRTRRPRMLLRTQVTLNAPVDEVFRFFSQPQNLGLLTPAAMRFRIRRAPEHVQEGSVIDYVLRVAGTRLRWRTVIAHWAPGVCFVDAQTRGPYRTWWHEHHFHSVPGAPGLTVMEDRVFFAAPFGWLGRMAQGLFVLPALRQVFGYRTQAIRLRFRAV